MSHVQLQNRHSPLAYFNDIRKSMFNQHSISLTYHKKL